MSKELRWAIRKIIDMEEDLQDAERASSKDVDGLERLKKEVGTLRDTIAIIAMAIRDHKQATITQPGAPHVCDTVLWDVLKQIPNAY